MKLSSKHSWSLIVIAASVLQACGGDTGEKDDAPAPQPEQPGEQTPAEKPVIDDGKYYLSAGVVEAFDNQGNKLDPQTLQISGDFYWDMSYLQEGRYQVIASGAVKVSTENEIIAEVNCRGARDVYIFELREGNMVRNLHVQ
jgi:hypothetical protein